MPPPAHYDFNIRNHQQFVEKSGLWERPEDWEWSSFRHYATGGAGRVEIECEWTARARERAAGRLRPAVKLSHPSQKWAEWATRLRLLPTLAYGCSRGFSCPRRSPLNLVWT